VNGACYRPDAARAHRDHPIRADLSEIALRSKTRKIDVGPRCLRDAKEEAPRWALRVVCRSVSDAGQVQSTRIGITTAEERAKLMDVKHAMLVQRRAAERLRVARQGGSEHVVVHLCTMEGRMLSSAREPF